MYKLRTSITRLLLGLMVVGTAALSMAQTLTVTSPSSGEFLGLSNQLKFLIDGAASQAKVVSTTTNTANPTISFRTEGLFDPDSNNKINGSLNLNFDEATPAGTYNIVVDYFQQGSLVTSRTITNVRIDTKAPKFRNITPANGSFLSGLIAIGAELEEPNVDLWTVKVNSRDIPSNTGSTTAISVIWDPSTIERDGSQTISIEAKDLARNSASRQVVVNLDRIKPSAAVRSPSTIGYRPGSTIPVQIDITDQFEGSVRGNGVTVTLRTMDGQFIQTVARRGVRQSGTTLQWVGRIRKTTRIPNTFKLLVTVQDRAGNQAVNQEVVVRYGN